MDFLDEKIVEARRKESQKELNIREDGLIANGERIDFQETPLFHDKMTILLPTTFVDMPQRIARIKYPSEQRPQIIKTDLLGSTNFAFNLFDKVIKPVQMQSAADGMKSILKKVLKEISTAINIYRSHTLLKEALNLLLVMKPKLLIRGTAYTCLPA